MGARSRNKPASSRKDRSAQTGPKNIWLTLTLVPFIIGVILIGAWLLDLSLLQPEQTQITVGAFFLLGSFALSNALQKNWLPAVGWSLLCVADWLVLTRLQVVIQVIGMVIGAAGLVLIGIEFYRRWKNRQPDSAKKT